MIPHLCPFELKIKMADEDEIFRKFRRKTPEWMADFETPCFSLEWKIFKSTTRDGEPAPVVETPSTSEISNKDGNHIAESEGNSDSQELEDFITIQKSSNTVKKTKSDVRVLKRLCSTIDETREPETKRNSTNYFQDFLKILQKKIAKSTNRVHSRHSKEASSATFLRSYLSIS